MACTEVCAIMALEFSAVNNFNGYKIKKHPARYYLRSFIYSITLLQSFPVSMGINARIEFHIDGIGFHRNFIYHVKLINFNEENCRVSLYHELPSSLYVNINELPDQKKKDVEEIKVCSVGETNVELFTENAQSQNVTICTNLTNASSTMSLWIHQRYWYPKEDGDYKDIILKKPSLLIGCKGRIGEYRVSKLDLCPLCAILAVKWRELPYHIDGENYAWTLPIADASSLPLVTFVTLLTTVIGTISLMRTIWLDSLIKKWKSD